MTKSNIPSNDAQFAHLDCLLCDGPLVIENIDGQRLFYCPTCRRERELAKARRQSRGRRVKSIKQDRLSAATRADQPSVEPRATSRVTCSIHGIRHPQLVIGGLQVVGCPDCLRARWMRRIAE